MSHHPTVDLEHWLAVFPLEHLRDVQEAWLAPYPAWKDKPRSELRRLSCDTTISSPQHLAQLEQLRQPILDADLIEEGIPVDLFLWQQAPTQPWLTKLGGKPYLPAATAWPHDLQTGKPYTFIAQFCFLDSFDILPFQLPGDLLLVFFKSDEPGEDPACSSDDDAVHLEWVDVTDSDIIAESECPKISQFVPELYGVRYRGLDLIDRDDAFAKADCKTTWRLAETQATKIGTSTLFIQGYPDVPESATLVATLSSVELAERWPLIDTAAGPTEAPCGTVANRWQDRYLSFGDVGAVYFFLDENGTAFWRADCY